MALEEKAPIPQPTESEAIVASQRALPGAALTAPVPLPVDVAAGLAVNGLETEGDRIAKASITLDAPIAKVWEALVTPAMIKQYMFDTVVTSDWKEGGAITWEGDYDGKHYLDKGVIVKFESQRALQYTHYSPMTGSPDIPENYHTISLELSALGTKTILSVFQDKNRTDAARDHAAKFWEEMFQGIKRIV